MPGQAVIASAGRQSSENTYEISLGFILGVDSGGTHVAVASAR